MTDDFLDIADDTQRKLVEQAALETAALYTIFVTDERGKKLLELWDSTLRSRRTPVNAPHTEYAANEALRAFIEGIHQQIRLATTPRGTV